MLKNEGRRLTKVAVCTPGREYFSVTDLRSHNITEVPDPGRTLEQFAILKSILKKAGCEVVDASELPGHPNSVFTRDVSLVTPRGYIKLKMGLDSRRGEEEWMAAILDSLGEPYVGGVNLPGTVEGGDVILAEDVAFVGHSQRTNLEGIEQISEFLENMGYEVRIHRMDFRYLHLGGAMSMIGLRRILCCRDVFSEGFFAGFDTVEVPHRGPSTGNVICLQENEVIANIAENVEAIREMEKEGIQVHAIDLSEFRKGTGGPTCLILPIERI
ncbi:MAG: arginine deiminase family protein [Candidatus Aminicenantes bacterium]|jgi:dimethylargininase